MAIYKPYKKISESSLEEVTLSADSVDLSNYYNKTEVDNLVGGSSGGSTAKIYTGATGTAANEGASNPYIKIANNGNVDSEIQLIASGSGLTIRSTTAGKVNFSLSSIINNIRDGQGTMAVEQGDGTIASGTASHAEGLGEQSSVTLQSDYAVNNDAIAYFDVPLETNRVLVSETSGEIFVVDGGTAQENGEVSLVCTDETSSNTYPGGEMFTADKGRAYGDYSHNEGYKTVAAGIASHSEGHKTASVGYASHSQGYKTVALGDYQTVFGQCNVMDRNSLFIIGNGTHSGEIDTNGNEIFETINPNNAFRVENDGTCYSGSSFSNGGADYAEYFEWADGNPDNEDRVGYFVMLNGDGKIEKTTAGSDPLGIISATPFGVGAVYDQHWKDKYLKDEFGRVQYREVVIPAKIKDKKIIIPARKEMHPILNPNYDASKEYVSRALRKEWSPVGLIGQLVVRDNGACTVGGYCKAGADGLAVPATRTDEFHYRVIERTSENTIRVFFK